MIEICNCMLSYSTSHPVTTTDTLPHKSGGTRYLIERRIQRDKGEVYEKKGLL